MTFECSTHPFTNCLACCCCCLFPGFRDQIVWIQEGLKVRADDKETDGDFPISFTHPKKNTANWPFSKSNSFLTEYYSFRECCNEHCLFYNLYNNKPFMCEVQIWESLYFALCLHTAYMCPLIVMCDLMIGPMSWPLCIFNNPLNPHFESQVKKYIKSRKSQRFAGNLSTVVFMSVYEIPWLY